MQGADPQTVQKVRAGAPPDDASENIKLLFGFVEKLTLKPGAIEKREVDASRSAGWTDEQIAEATYVTALFAFFNRVASAFGLEDPRYEEKLAAGEKDVPAAQQKPVELE